MQNHCSDCEKLLVKPENSMATGYAVLPNGSKICYPCADKRQVEEMKDRSAPFVAYISTDSKSVTTWTGGFLGRITWSNSTANPRGIYSRETVAINVIDAHGKKWHGRGPGSGMCVRLFPSKH